MTALLGLLDGCLDAPADGPRRLVLADWLEEHGGADGPARAELLRLQAERDAARLRRQRVRLDGRAKRLRKRWPGLLGALEGLCGDAFSPLEAGPVLAVFLAAPLAAPGGPLAAGRAWDGALVQDGFAFPTALRLRRRDGAAVEGEMDQDFAERGLDVATFSFRGAAAGPHLALVTHHVEGQGIYPGLYLLRHRHGGWLRGTWEVPSWGYRGEMTLRRRDPVL